VCRVLEVGLLLTMSSCMQPQPARIAVSNTEYQFGDVCNGQRIEHTFSFRNEGDQTLELTKAVPSCGCVAVELRQQAVPPGEEGLLSCSLVAMENSSLHYTIVLFSNSTCCSPTLFTLSLNHTNRFRLEPGHIYFSHEALKGGTKREVRLKTDGTLKGRITRFPSFESGCIRVEATGTQTDRFALWFQQAPAGKYHEVGYATVTDDSGREYVFALPVEAEG